MFLPQGKGRNVYPSRTFDPQLPLSTPVNPSLPLSTLVDPFRPKFLPFPHFTVYSVGPYCCAQHSDWLIAQCSAKCLSISREIQEDLHFFILYYFITRFGFYMSCDSWKRLHNSDILAILHIPCIMCEIKCMCWPMHVRCRIVYNWMKTWSNN
jgi:hypothetical protein